MALANITNNILTDSGILVTNLTPTSRTLTINGVTYDLSADRSWTIAGGLSGSGTANQLTYWDGTSSVTGSATLTYSPTAQLLVNNSVTAASAIARGANFTPTLTAAANNDVLVGLDINPTFNVGAFTGYLQYGLRVRASTNQINQTDYVARFENTNPLYGNGIEIIGAADKGSLRLLLRAANNDNTDVFRVRGNGSISVGTGNNNNLGTVIDNNSISLGGYQTISNSGSVGIVFSPFSAANAVTFRQSGNVLIGTTTDAGFRLDVNGTARTQQLHTFLQGTLLDSTSASNFYSVNTGSSTYGGLALRNQTQDYTGYIQTGRSGNANGINFFHTTFAGATSGDGHQKFSSTAVVFGSTSKPQTLTIFKVGGSAGTAQYPLVLNNQTNTTNTGVGLIFQTGNETGGGPIDAANITAYKTNLGGGFVTSSLRFSTINDGANTLSEKMRISDAGNLLVGTTTDGPNQFTLGGSETASSAIARGQLLNTTLVAAANNDVLVGLDINPTFTNGAFTGVANVGLFIRRGVLNVVNGWAGTPNQGDIGYFGNPVGGAAQYIAIDAQSGFASGIIFRGQTTGRWTQYRDGATNNLYFLSSATAGNINFALFHTTNNVGINTSTDAGFRLDVNGTARVQTSLTIGGTTGNGGIVATDGTYKLEYITTSGNGKLRLSGSYPSLDLTDGSNSLRVKLDNGGPNGTLTLYSSGNARIYLNGLNNASDSYIQGSICIGANASPNASAMLDITSTGKGFLPPRMSTTQRNAISSPATGLVVYDTTDNELDYYNGTAWQSLMTLGTQQTVTGFKQFSASRTASLGVAQGTLMTPTLTASANNDVLVGLDISPTYSNGAFTGVTNTALRVIGNTTISGNLGIATTAPLQKLHVIGNIWAEGNIGFYTSGGAGLTFADRSGNDLRIYTPSGATKFVDATGLTTFATITSSGDVGIGPTAPAYRLEVQNSTGDDHIAAVGTAPSLQLMSANTGPANWATIGMATASNHFIVGAAAGDFCISNRGTTAGNMLFGFSSSEKMRLTSSGNLLIGTTTEATEAGLNLGAKTTDEGGQLVLQKGTSYTYAAHVDNYQDLFRVMSGTNTTSSSVKMSINLSTGNATFNSSIQTGAPSGGTAQPWKLGTVYTGTCVPSDFGSFGSWFTGTVIEIEVNGTTYKIPAIIDNYC